MEPRFVCAKLASDKIAREAELWRALEALTYGTGGAWISIFLFAVACFMLITAEIPPKILPALGAVLLMNVAVQIQQSRRLGAVAELVRLKLKE